MSGTTPRRRHSPAVYRRRRLAVLLVAVLVVAGLVWLFVAQPWRSVAAAGEAPAPVASPTASSPSPTASAPAETTTPLADGEAAEGGGGDAGAGGDTPTSEMTPEAEGCLPGSISVEAVTNQQTYASGQNPELSIRLTNTSGVDCTLDVGTSAQSFTISSGSDTWWRSTDCQSEPSSMIVLLKAGQEVSSAAPLTWDRTRSSTSSCQSERPSAPGGGATYHLSVAIAGIPSANTAMFQLY